MPVFGKLEDIPIFAPSGAIIPLILKKLTTKEPIINWAENPARDQIDKFELRIFAGANRQFELYDDGGEDLTYRQGNNSITVLQQIWQANPGIPPQLSNISDNTDFYFR